MPATPPSRLPFEHLNLRRNPFGELEAWTRAELAVVDELRLEDGEVLQITGGCGRGKTTHLLALAAGRPGARYVRIEPGGRPSGTKTRRWAARLARRHDRRRALLLDEAQFLRPGTLRRLCRRFETLALGTHRDLSGYCKRPVRKIALDGLDCKKLLRIINKRLAWARRAPGPVPRVPDESAREFIRRYGDDIRAIEDHLYEVFQELKEPKSVQV